MPLSIPNVFVSQTTIESEKVQENVDAIKNYLDGGMAVGDIRTSEHWVETKHIMKGVYFSTDNSYEMVSGLYKGVPTVELPQFAPGYAGIYLGESVSSPVPGCGISFYLEHDADIIFKYQISPRGIPLTSALDGTLLSVKLDGNIVNYTQGRFSKEADTTPAYGAGADGWGFYRRRFYQVEEIYAVVSAGYHTLTLENRGSLRAVPLKFCSYSVQALYRI